MMLSTLILILAGSYSLIVGGALLFIELIKPLKSINSWNILKSLFPIFMGIYALMIIGKLRRRDLKNVHSIVTRHGGRGRLRAVDTQHPNREVNYDHPRESVRETAIRREQEQTSWSVYKYEFDSIDSIITAERVKNAIINENHTINALVNSGKYSIYVSIISRTIYALAIIGNLTRSDLESAHSIVTQYNRGYKGKLLQMDTQENTLQQSSSKNRGMKCILGIHRWNKCICTRCGEKRYRNRQGISILMSIPSLPEDRQLKDVLQILQNIKEVRAVLQQHDWHGCTCFLCHTQHIYVHHESAYLNKRVSSTDGLYRQYLICAICGKQYGRDKAEEDTIF